MYSGYSTTHHLSTTYDSPPIRRRNKYTRGNKTHPRVQVTHAPALTLSRSLPAPDMYLGTRDAPLSRLSCQHARMRVLTISESSTLLASRRPPDHHTTSIPVASYEHMLPRGEGNYGEKPATYISLRDRDRQQKHERRKKGTAYSISTPRYLPLLAQRAPSNVCLTQSARRLTDSPSIFSVVRAELRPGAPFLGKLNS